ncbi:uncharacterized protein PAC_15404 [Phialocephala subalpina]|uniref:Zn(2)-C6 fungal-type domain-containing protein n=1 Tax=Phialocephala subalpina TaxID=576137 RepID=A0A1L7XKG4_9HELO|nr:uncharacterized protein PAC_15404 [Phialocephala subalpina]
MATKNRSSTGCWTCRLRRKKCDETKPVCLRCSKLQLTCDGYAQRPFWMDGGYQEKMRAEQTKQAVRDRKSLSGTSKSSEQSISRPANPSLSTQENASLESDWSVEATMATYQSQGIPDLTISELTAGEEAFGAWQMEAHSHSLLAIHQDQGLGQDAYPSERELQQLFGPLSTSPTDELQLELQSFHPMPMSPHLETESLSLSLSPSQSRSRSRMSSSSPSASASSSSMSGSGSSCRSNCIAPPTLEEAGLLLHYLDNMQTLQLPFCGPRAADRAWQYVLITRTRASYWATLSLSSYGLGQDGSCYHELALLELRKNLPAAIAFAGRDAFTSALDCCFSTLQLIFLETLRGQSKACRVHMSAAFKLLAGLGKVCHSDVRAVDSAALRFIAVSLRWCDAMLSCSLRTAPSLLSLEWPATTVPSSASTGSECCYHHWQDLVIASISQIAALDAWKKKLAEAGRLSVVDLVKRATAIETRLEECERASMSGEATSDRFPNLLPAGIQDEATGTVAQYPTHLLRHVIDIFASAALVYLHIVVAGAHRWVPDVSNRVRATVDLFRKLPSAQALNYLTWPLCLAGCLAEGEDREFLMVLAGKASAEETDAVRRIGKVVDVLKECWRLADSGETADPDWTSAMNSLGYEVILL